MSKEAKEYLKTRRIPDRQNYTESRNDFDLTSELMQEYADQLLKECQPTPSEGISAKEYLKSKGYTNEGRKVDIWEREIIELLEGFKVARIDHANNAVAELMGEVVRYRGAIEGALRIKDLWVLNEANVSDEHLGEFQALSLMKQQFEQVLSQSEPSEVKEDWISVEDRLPEGIGFVDCIYFEEQFGNTLTGMFNTKTKNFMKHNFDKVIEVTHWQPLPPPPTK